MNLRTGDRVILSGGFGAPAGKFRMGTLVKPARRFGLKGWIVSLDAPYPKYATEVFSLEVRLRPAPPTGSDWLRRGQKVELTAFSLRGRTGTLIRPAHLLLKPAWLVELDQP